MNQWNDGSKAPKKSETYLCVFNIENFKLDWYNVNPVTGKSDIASYRDYDKWKKQGLK